jgi:hypothetical protein
MSLSRLSDWRRSGRVALAVCLAGVISLGISERLRKKDSTAPVNVLAAASRKLGAKP